MAADTGALYGGRHRKVLEHPDHTNGVNHGTMTVTGFTELAPSVTRITARLDHEGDESRWFVVNPAIRLELLDPETSDTVSRVYTVRSTRRTPAGLEIDVDVVRHPGRSVMMAWLSAIELGTTVRILGPRQHFSPKLDDGAVVGLFADETAIPALATILREWPDGRAGRAWIETPDEAVVEDLPARPEVRVQWLRREAHEAAGTTGRLVAEARRFGEAHPERASVWACGEHGEMKQIRDHFRKERGMERERVVVFGYWRRHLTSSQIDEDRLRRYERALEANPRMTVLDDFEDGD